VDRVRVEADVRGQWRSEIAPTLGRISRHRGTGCWWHKPGHGRTLLSRRAARSYDCVLDWRESDRRVLVHRGRGAANERSRSAGRLPSADEAQQSLFVCRTLGHERRVSKRCGSAAGVRAPLINHAEAIHIGGHDEVVLAGVKLGAVVAGNTGGLVDLATAEGIAADAAVAAAAASQL